jgi:acyl-CoA synthetase (AMP-forming)/AMP-acid ligase II/thioesterase domain-containing protein
MLDPLYHPRNLLGLLRQAAALHPNNGIVTLDDPSLYDLKLQTTTYLELLEQATANALFLSKRGIVVPGQVTPVYFHDHYSNIVWTWSVICAGGIPAIVSALSCNDDVAQDQKQNIVDLYGRCNMLTSSNLSNNFQNIDCLSLFPVDSDLFDVQECVDLNIRLPGDNARGQHVAAILHTSGSTGRAKGVELQHRQLLQSVRAKQKMHGIKSSNNFLAWMSFDHSANFCELHLNAIGAGAMQYQLEPSQIARDPSQLWLVLARYEIAYTLVPNSILGRANIQFEANLRATEMDLSRLRLMAVGGEANYASTLAKANQIATGYGAPEGAVKAAYGLTETCSASFYNLYLSEEEIRQEQLFSSAGVHLPFGIRLRLVDAAGKQVSCGRDGRIQLCGEVVFKGYHNNAAATSACMTKDGWFDTGDEGHLDQDGSLQITGRSKEIMIINGNNYSSSELEYAILKQVNDSVDPTFVASFGVSDPMTQSECPVILFALQDGLEPWPRQMRELIERLQTACISYVKQTPADVICLPKSEMPKSTLGKLSRATLKRRYLEGDFQMYQLRFDDGMPMTPLTTPTAGWIAGLISEVAGISIDGIFMETRLADCGLDSLRYMRLKSMLEESMFIKTTVPMPLLLGARTIADLEASLLQVSAELCNEYSPLITMQSGGSRTPLYLVHPGGGDIWNWLNLVKYLPDRPIFAFRLRGLPPFDDLFDSLEEMLDTYEAAIIQQQPHGPYAFLGHCFGGSIAFELAKRMEARGEEVSFCGGIDQPPQLAIKMNNQDFKVFLLRLVALLGAVSMEESVRLQEIYQHISLKPRAFVRKLWDDIGEHTFRPVGLTFKKFDSWCRVFERSCDIAREYKVSGRVSNFHSFWVATSDFHDEEEWEAMIHDWDSYAGKTSYHQVDGNHFNILVEPQVNVCQAKLNGLLEELGV